MPLGPLLIADDEAPNLAALRQILSPEYRLVFARDGAETLAAVRKHDPALILLDIQMPDMDGYTVCRTLKADLRTEHIPVIFVSAMSEVGDEAAGFEAGGVDYLHKPVSPLIVRARVRTHLSLVRATRLEKSYRDGIFMLAEAGHYNDADTGVHVWRMAAYARAIAAASGWREDACRVMELSAPMHDTGKIGIPDAILRKPGPLDDEEWKVMMTHTTIGYEILSKSDAPVFCMAAEIARHHHERWDGSGYPDGLAGETIPESARIVALADVFDALTMKRAYKEPWSVERALETMHEGGGQHFDPRLLEVFESSMAQIRELKASWDGVERERAKRLSEAGSACPAARAEHG